MISCTPPRPAPLAESTLSSSILDGEETVRKAWGGVTAVFDALPSPVAPRHTKHLGVGCDYSDLVVSSWRCPWLSLGGVNTGGRAGNSAPSGPWRWNGGSETERRARLLFDLAAFPSFFAVLLVLKFRADATSEGSKASSHVVDMGKSCRGSTRIDGKAENAIRLKRQKRNALTDTACGNGRGNIQK